MALVALFAGQNLIFEQRTSANEYRSERAFELAEAGLEWAIARMNDPVALAPAPSCSTATTGGAGSFADRYLPIAASGFTIDAKARSGCSIASNGATACSCPAGATPSFPTPSDARFTVQFHPVAGDPWAVEIVASGCTSESSVCDPASASRADAIAVVRAIARMKPTFAHAPGAAIVAGTNVASSGSLRVINTDAASNGATINAGSTVELASEAVLTTLAGTPAAASVIDRDASLAKLAATDTLFAAYFGETKAQYIGADNTWLVGSEACGSRMRCSQCSTPAGCGAAVLAAYRERGVQKFWLAAEALFSGALGSDARPLVVASAANFSFDADTTAYGMFYSDSAWSYSGTGAARLVGSLVSRSSAGQAGIGTLDVVYEPRMFRSECPNPTQPCAPRGAMIRIPGSWRDR